MIGFVPGIHFDRGRALSQVFIWVENFAVSRRLGFSHEPDDCGEGNVLCGSHWKGQLDEDITGISCCVEPSSLEGYVLLLGAWILASVLSLWLYLFGLAACSRSLFRVCVYGEVVCVGFDFGQHRDRLA